MFIDFWGTRRPQQPADLRAIAEQQLADFSASIIDGSPRPVIYLQRYADWLLNQVPPEWHADLVATIARYPACDYLIYTMRPENWQRIMKAVAALDSEGGKIAARWLDGTPPPGLSIICAPPQRLFTGAIPQARREAYLERETRIQFIRDIAETDRDRYDGEVFDTTCYARAGDFGTIVGLAGPFGYLVTRDGDSLDFDAYLYEEFIAAIDAPAPPSPLASRTHGKAALTH